MPDLRTRKKIKKAKINFISLCPKGKNRLEVLYKADDDSKDGTNPIEMGSVIEKFDDEKGILKAIVYAPNLDDADNHYMELDAIEKTAFDFAKNQKLGAIDIVHNEKALPADAACVVESYIVKANDPDFQNQTTRDGVPFDPTGSWAVTIQLGNEDLRQKYRDGEWAGISMGGRGNIEEDLKMSQISEDQLKELGIDVIKSDSKKENEMADNAEFEKLAKAVEANNSQMAELIKALAPKEEPQTEEEPKEEKVLSKSEQFKQELLDAAIAEKQEQLEEMKKSEDGVDLDVALALAAEIEKLEKGEIPSAASAPKIKIKKAAASNATVVDNPEEADPAESYASVIAKSYKDMGHDMTEEDVLKLYPGLKKTVAQINKEAN